MNYKKISSDFTEILKETLKSQHYINIEEIVVSDQTFYLLARAEDAVQLPDALAIDLDSGKELIITRKSNPLFKMGKS